MKTKTFRVQGPRTQFPVDMLRYDSCWPYSGQDASTIHDILSLPRSEKSDLPARLTVVLQSASPTAPTAERWNSFGWSVVS